MFRHITQGREWLLLKGFACIQNTECYTFESENKSNSGVQFEEDRRQRNFTRNYSKVGNQTRNAA